MFVDQLPEHVPDTGKKARRAALRGTQALRGAKAKAQLSPTLSVAMAEEKLERLRIKRKPGTGK